MIVTAKSMDDENPELSMIARRGYGGVAILWKKEMDDKISVMVDGSNRIQKFLAENSLELNQEYPEKETFFHHNGKSSGQIDYFFSASKDLTQYVQILDMEAENTSDHVPVVATIKRKLIRKSNKPKSVIVRTKWEKCNLQKYQLTISDGVEKILQASNKNIEEDIISIEKVMHNACNEAIPNYNKSIRTKSTGKSLWNKNISEASKIAKEKHALWKNRGAPKDKNNRLKSQLTTAKRLLRKAHRQAYASQREKLANQIMTASSSDNKLLHKLLRTQRSDGNRFTKTLRRDNQTAETNEDILHMWTDYFYEISNPDYKQDFDYEKYELSSLQNTIIEKIEKGKAKIEPIREEEIHDAVKGLKNGKSSDIDGISAEHYKNAETELLPLILHIINTVIEQLDIPQMLKGGIMTPVLKKNKDRQNTANYRGITVTKIFTKILQSVLKSRIDIKIHQIQNQLQRGFTEAIPMIFAAILASEAIIQSSEDDQEVLLLTLDAEKAFDKLEHEILFHKVYHYCIDGDMWILLRNMYREMSIRIKWDDLVSDQISVNQGIQQGAKLSTSLYKCYNNAILDSVTESGLGCHMGTIGIATPTCADDILVLANSECELQGIMDIVYHHTLTWSKSTHRNRILYAIIPNRTE
ncbi:unnamed protein product [Mytilus coruscus]|uniref:Reverse transcriptase domain-containing protein n=1 Tax=Mytilus coruscus TaxID=42192 RepID=A0A6J8B203_MYTCO|nr:unnamed protein product [Mytilus coruscus]